VGIHWGTFKLTYEHYLAPRVDAKNQAEEAGLKEGEFNVVNIGETVQWMKKTGYYSILAESRLFANCILSKEVFLSFFNCILRCTALEINTSFFKLWVTLYFFVQIMGY